MCHYGQMGLERTANKSQHTMLNLEKSILQRGRVFFCETVWMPAFVMLLHESNLSLKRMLSASFGDNLITLDYAAEF